MEVIRGKKSASMPAALLNAIQDNYQRVQVDIGTGDGRFVRQMAHQHPSDLIIGVDACRENLHDASRRAPDNALFVIANAQNLPPELDQCADRITINFPWGSLLEGLLIPDSPVMMGLQAIARPDSSLVIRLNAGALAEAGYELEAGAHQIKALLTHSGFNLWPPVQMSQVDLVNCPTTWAKRLAFGRDPRAIVIEGLSMAETRLKHAG